MAYTVCIKINLLFNTALRVLLSAIIFMSLPHPETDVSFHQQSHTAGWEFTSTGINWIPQQVSSGKPHCHLKRSVSWTPPPTKMSSLQKIWRIFFSSTYGRTEGPPSQCRGLGHESRPSAIMDPSRPNSLVSLAHPFGPKQTSTFSGSFPPSPSSPRCPSCSSRPQ